MQNKVSHIQIWGVTTFIFILGLVITTYLYQSKKVEEIAQAQSEFKLEASLRSKDIQSKFMRSFFQVSSLANLFASSTWVSHQEFMSFISSVFPSFQEGRRLSAIKHLNIDDEDNFLKAIATNPEAQFKKFEIYDLVNNNKITPATSYQNAYNFIQYTFPEPKIPSVYGRNIRQDSRIGPRLYKAINNTSPVISDMSVPLPGIIEYPFFIHIQPILKFKQNNTKDLSGIIISSQPIEHIFDHDTINQTLKLFSYQIFDQAGNRYDYPQKKFYPKGGLLPKQEAIFVYENPIDIVGGQWTLRVLLTDMLNDQSEELLFNLALSGSILSFLFALISYLIMNQRSKLTQQVEEKTAELNKAMVELNKNNQRLISAVKSSEKSAKIKAEFLANMSHEIRTPLNGIYGFLQLLTKTQLDQKQTNFISNMEHSVKHLKSVINDILDFSKIEAGKISIETVPFSLHKFIDSLKNSVEQSAKKKGIGFSVNLLTELNPDLLGDVVRLNQVLLNLCSNAVKFTEKGEVSVNISMQLTEPSNPKSPIKIDFEVVDTGIGLKPADLDGLFQAFTQADTSTTRRFGGTGLGLSISQKLCQLMGGEITVKSQFGVGSQFTASMVFEQNNEIIETKGVDKKLEHPVSILLVDDNPIAISTLESSLKQMNAKVWSSTSCYKAIEHLKQFPNQYDIIISDWTMKEMNGGKFLDQILSLDLERQPQFIILSAYDLSVIEDSTPKLPIVSILQKPCLDSQLFDVISKAIINTANGLESTNKNKSLAGLRILVAEDNRINQVVIKTMLTSEGIEVVITGNGELCIEELNKNEPFDLILMDIQMPILDGIEATKIIRSLPDPQRANIPIIALTANVMKENVASYLAIGMNTHAAKPVEFGALKASILKLVG